MNAQESKMAREVLDLVDELDRFVGKADAFLVDWKNLCGKLDNLKHKFFAGQEVKSTIKTSQDVSPSKPDIKSPRKNKHNNGLVQPICDCPKDYIPTIGRISSAILVRSSSEEQLFKISFLFSVLIMKASLNPVLIP